MQCRHHNSPLANNTFPFCMPVDSRQSTVGPKSIVHGHNGQCHQSTNKKLCRKLKQQMSPAAEPIKRQSLGQPLKTAEETSIKDKLQIVPGNARANGNAVASSRSLWVQLPIVDCLDLRIWHVPNHCASAIHFYRTGQHGHDHTQK